MKDANQTTSVATETVKPANQADAIKLELNAQSDALSAFVKSSGSIGALGRESLAVKLGEETNKSGRPSFGSYMAFTAAVMANRTPYSEQNRLCAIANKHVTHDKANGEHVQVAKSKAKGEQGGASCSYRINKPVAWEIAIGE